MEKMTIERLTNIVDNYTYFLLGELLFEKVPNFSEKYLEIYDPETKIGSYNFFDDFASTLIEDINSKNRTSYLIDAFNFINECCETTNLEILNIIRVGFFEKLYSEVADNRDFVRGLLNDKSLNMFNKCSEYIV